jgi:glyoxylate/hydroxypyruvate reductase
MALLIVATDRDTSRLATQVQAIAPEIEVRNWPDLGRAEEIEFAVVWRQPPGLLAGLPALKAVSSLGAGVEHILADPDLPPDLPIGRLAGPRLASDMAAFLVAQVLWHWKGLDRYAELQRQQQWRPWSPRTLPTIGLLGTGQLGRAAAGAFQALDLPVAGWSRSGQGPAGVQMHPGDDGLRDIGAAVDYLICLLPLTEKTRGILDLSLFKAMKADAVLINVGRGEHLVEADLLEALDDDQLALAILDVFVNEPLPQDHPFWSHPKVRITPHCSAITRTDEAARLIVDSYRRIKANQSPLGLVRRELGY